MCITRRQRCFEASFPRSQMIAKEVSLIESIAFKSLLHFVTVESQEVTVATYVDWCFVYAYVRMFIFRRLVAARNRIPDRYGLILILFNSSMLTTLDPPRLVSMRWRRLSAVCSSTGYSTVVQSGYSLPFWQIFFRVSWILDPGRILSGVFVP